MADEVKKPWQHPPIRSPSTGEAGKWESTQGRDIFTPISEMDADAVGNDELERWLHPSPTYRSADSEPDENPNEEIEKQPPPDGKIIPESSRTTPGREIKPSLFGDPIENLESNVGKEQGYGNLDTAFTQDIGNNGVEDRDSETYIQSHTNGNKRKTDMNKINHTKVGDDIHYYVNGKEGRGIVVKMDNSYVMVAKEDGDFEDIHINDTFFVKDIVLNKKTWDNMDSIERYDALQKIHAPSPRFLMKSWSQIPQELQELLTKTGWTYEPGTSKDSESQDHDRTGSQQKTQYDSDIKEKREVTGNTEGIGSNARFGQNQSEKSDVELQHPGEPLLGGVSTVEEPLDAEEDYEGQTHDPKAEQFKHKESEYDAATGKKKDDGATTADAGGFNSIYGPHSGKPGTDQKYGDKKSGITGVPDYNVNTFGINYSASKQAHPPKKEDDDKDDTE